MKKRREKKRGERRIRKIEEYPRRRRNEEKMSDNEKIIQRQHTLEGYSGGEQLRNIKQI